MKITAVGRNDPCPCGSGKKFKKCCLGKEESVASDRGTTIASMELRQAMEGRQFDSLEEVQAFVEQFNWGYRDRYHELRFIQSAFLFTLYLLMRYGDAWRPHKFYEDSFLRAFPVVLNEVPAGTVFTPEEEVRNCYTWRTLVDFAGFFGLATVEPVSKERFCRQYRVKGLPLLHEAVQFHISG